VATGPATQNFADAVAALSAAGGLAQVADPAALTAWVDAMLRDAGARRRAGSAARAVATAQADLPAQLAARLVRLVR
jgi:3-deoxy-D-manno-octulosonic-acid transferase